MGSRGGGKRRRAWQFEAIELGLCWFGDDWEGLMRMGFRSLGRKCKGKRVLWERDGSHWRMPVSDVLSLRFSTLNFYLFNYWFFCWLRAIRKQEMIQEEVRVTARMRGEIVWFRACVDEWWPAKPMYSSGFWRVPLPIIISVKGGLWLVT